MLLVEELERLKSILLHMVRHIGEVVKDTRRLAESEDLEVRRGIWGKVYDYASMLDRLRREFVNEVLIFIAKRQPLGKELLIAGSLLSIAYDMYRIARYCREIARIDSMLAPDSGLAHIQGLSTLLASVVKAVEYVSRDLIEFKPINEDRISEIDKLIDESYEKILKTVSSSAGVDRETAMKLLLMRHIERIVDHTTYIENYLKNIY